MKNHGKILKCNKKEEEYLEIDKMEMKEFNIAEILKDFPKGTKLYSPLFEGDVSLQRIEENTIVIAKGASEHRFFWNGCYHICSSGECMLFPSRDQRDWSKFRKSHWLRKEE